MGLTCDVKAQPIAELQSQRLGDALFDTHAVGLLGQPAPGHQGVVARQDRAVREVDFTVEQAFAAVGDQVIRPDDPAIDGHQTAPDHGKPIGRLHACGFQMG